MAVDYSHDNLLERAAAAKLRHHDYLQAKLQAYDTRCENRKSKRIPVVSFSGPGRAGKDTAAEFFCHYVGITYPGSVSKIVLPFIAAMTGDTEQNAWTTRHERRLFWIEACNSLRFDDYTLLLRMTLGAGDVAVGCRGRLEFYHAVRDRIFDTTVWVDNPRVSADPTIEYGPSDCDFMIPNYGSYVELYARIERIVSLMRVQLFT